MKRLMWIALISLFMMPVAVNAGMIDLTVAGSSGTSNGALFLEAGIAPTGTGNIQSFVRISDNEDVVEGYNTSGRPLRYDENNSPQFTRDLALISIPTVTLNSVLYREFILDINQNSPDPLLSLDILNIYISAAPFTNPLPLVAGLGTPIYSLTTGDWIKLNYNLNAGSGKGDMFAYIPDNLFTGGAYVTLYSKFGVNHANNDGFEEWAVQRAPGVPPVPEPSMLLMIGAGILGIGLAARRRLRK